MLQQTDRERLATLEADRTWIKDTLVRLELAMAEVHKSVEAHLTAPRRHLVNGNGVPITGINIQVGQKTALAILALFSGGSLTGVLGLLKLWQVL